MGDFRDLSRFSGCLQDRVARDSKGDFRDANRVARDSKGDFRDAYRVARDSKRIFGISRDSGIGFCLTFW